jgi:hypothetical protein
MGSILGAVLLVSFVVQFGSSYHGFASYHPGEGDQGQPGGREGVPGWRGAEQDALVVGRADAGWAGLRTKVVET